MFYLTNTLDTFGSDDIANQIVDLRKLSVGWHYGKGVPPSEEVIKQSLVIYNKIKLGFGRLFSLSVTPTMGGDVVLTVGLNNQFIDIFINNDKTVDMKHESGFGADYTVIENKNDVSFESITIRLCFLSDFSTTVPTSKIRGGLLALSGTIKASLSLMNIVGSKQAVPYANTSHVSTMQLQTVQ